MCCLRTRQQFSASLDYFVTSLPPYLLQFSAISGGNCINDVGLLLNAMFLVSSFIAYLILNCFVPREALPYVPKKQCKHEGHLFFPVLNAINLCATSIEKYQQHEGVTPVLTTETPLLWTPPQVQQANPSSMPP